MAKYYDGKKIMEKAMGTDAYFQIRSILTSLEPEDVAPIYRAHWIATGKVDSCDNIECKCSRCGYLDDFAPDTTVFYCWNCGSFMDYVEGLE